MARAHEDRGQVTVALTATVFVGLLVGVLLIATVGRAVGDRARARTAADAAALAGAREGEDGARALAERNGGRLLQFHRQGDDVEVTVQVGDRQAVARARLDIAPRRGQ
jgi:secretion/DNA translocation related TadE-like protein